MKKIRWKKISELLVDVFLLGVIFFTPLVFSFSIRVVNVFSLPKFVLLFVFVMILLILLSLQLLFFERQVDYYFRRIRKVYKDLRYFCLYLLFIFLISLFSVDFESSFWGSYERQLGVLSVILCFFVFFILIVRINSNKEILRIMRIMITSSSLVCIYGIIQKIGLDEFLWKDLVRIRVSSTFGQANILASFLLIIMPILFYLFFEAKRVGIKFLYGVIFVLHFICFYWTVSRGAFLGLIMASILYFLVYLIYLLKSGMFNGRRKKSIIIGGFLVLLGVILVFNFTFLGKRLRLIGDTSSGTVAFRIHYWKGALSSAFDNFLFGVGLENQDKELVKLYSSKSGLFDSVNMIPDRAHNIIIDYLLTVGIVGLLCYLFLLFVVLRICFLNIKKQADVSFYLACSFSIVACFFSLMFNFSSITLELYFWILFALIIVKSNGFVGSEESNYKDVRDGGRGRLFLNIVTICLLSFLFFFLLRGVKMYVADYNAYEMRQAGVRRELFNVLTFYEEAVKYDWNHNNDQYNTEFLMLIVGMMEDLDPVRRKLVEDKVKKISFNFEGDDFFTILNRANLYTILLGDNSEDFAKKVENEFEKLLKINNEIPLVYKMYARMLFRSGDYDRSIKIAQRGIEMLPVMSDRVVSTHAKKSLWDERNILLMTVGDSYMMKGEYLLAREAYVLSLEDKVTNIFVFEKIADTFYLMDDTNGAVEYMIRGWENDKNNFTWVYKVVKLYLKNGDWELADEYVKKARDQYPDNQVVKKLENEVERSKSD